MFHDEIMTRGVRLINSFPQPFVDPSVFYFNHIDMEDDNLTMTGREFYKNDFVKLPSKNSIFIRKVEKDSKELVAFLVQESEDGDGFYAVSLYESGFGTAELVYMLKKDVVIYPNEREYVSYKSIGDTSTRKLTHEQHLMSCKIVLNNVFTCLISLSSKYMDVKKEEISEKLQNARQKRGKSKLLDYVIVSLKPQYRQSNQHEHHGTVKPHWRRGHIRTLEDGRKVAVRETWVNLAKAEEPIKKKPYLIK